MSTRVKICGLTTVADRDAAVSAGADAVGFITEVPVDTSREIPPDRAATLVADVPPFVSAVLVTMPDTVEKARSLQETVGADAVQIHGTLSPSEIGDLRSGLSVPVIAACDVHDPDVEGYAEQADLLLVDSTSEDGGGGTGRTHDWERTREIVANVDCPVVLAGGLDPENVGAAIETVEPFGVDTASGVEESDGRKDHDAVRRFVEASTCGQRVRRPEGRA